MNYSKKTFIFLSRFFLFIIVSFLVSCAPTVEKTLDPKTEGFSQNSTVKDRLTILKEAAATVTDWNTYATARYEEFGSDILTKLVGYSNTYQVLMVDPGIAIRIDDFIKFLHDKAPDKNDPWAARKAYSDSLGNNQFYRGLVLSQPGLDNIKTNGVQSTSLRKGKAAEQSLKESILKQVLDRLMETNKDNDPLMSITKSYDIARSVPCSYNELASSERVYVFYYELPVLDTFAPPMNKKWFDERYKKALVDNQMPSTAEDVEKLYYSADIESFILFQLSNSEITKIDVMTPTSKDECKNTMSAARGR